MILNVVDLSNLKYFTNTSCTSLYAVCNIRSCNLVLTLSLMDEIPCCNHSNETFGKKISMVLFQPISLFNVAKNTYLNNGKTIRLLLSINRLKVKVTGKNTNNCQEVIIS